MSYFDTYGLMHLSEDPGPQDTENSPLFTAYYYALSYEVNGEVPWYNVNVAATVIQKNGVYYNNAETDNTHFSHDNMTGLYALYALAKKPVYKLPILKWNGEYWLHPRDIIFYGYAQGKLWAKLLLFIPCLAMIISCLQQYKVRNGQKFVKTDGKLLAWLRCKVWGLHKTYAICTWVLSKRGYFKETGWRGVFATYFQDQNHPINKLARVRYMWGWSKND